MKAPSDRRALSFIKKVVGQAYFTLVLPAENITPAKAANTISNNPDTTVKRAFKSLLLLRTIRIKTPIMANTINMIILSIERNFY